MYSNNQRYINVVVTKSKVLGETNGKGMPNNKNIELSQQKMDIIDIERITQ